MARFPHPFGRRSRWGRFRALGMQPLPTDPGSERRDVWTGPLMAGQPPEIEAMRLSADWSWNMLHHAPIRRWPFCLPGHDVDFLGFFAIESGQARKALYIAPNGIYLPLWLVHQGRRLRQEIRGGRLHPLAGFGR